MKILEQINRRLDLFNHLIQPRRAGSLVEALRFFCDWMDVPAGTMPLLKVHSNTFFCRLAAISTSRFWHAHFLVRDDVEDRITGADEGLDFRLKVHRMFE